MSDDGLSDYFDEPNMEIQIETLMGTCFDLRVYPTDTTEDIKRRIQRVEGIPVHQQSLVYQSKELKDSHKLCDAGVRNGSTIKLVLSMKGGPISTRRLPTCEHRWMLKELKELLENTRDEMGEKLSPGSKISVLVFKEGDIINLLRVIENDDGSYSPYNEKPISPPPKPTKKESYMSMFEKLAEDEDMLTKVTAVRKKMEDVTTRRNTRRRDSDKSDAKSLENDEACAKSDSKKNKVSYKLLTEYSSDMLEVVNDLKNFEKTLDDENHSETEEIALKEKHRTKQTRLQKARSSTLRSLYSENKGAYSRTKDSYMRIHKKNKEMKPIDLNSRERKISDEAVASTSKASMLCKKNPPERALTPNLTEVAILEESDKNDLCVPFSEKVNLSTRNRVHLTRLVLSETSERPKSSPDSIELEENAQDLFEIHESPSERLKHSATCKVGLLKRRQSVDFGCEGLENPSKVKQDLSDFNYCKSSSGVCSSTNVCSSNFYHMPQLSAVPSQYAPKQNNLYDCYFSDNSRSPLYGRKTKSEEQTPLFTRKSDSATRLPALPKLTETNKAEKYNFLTDYSSIQRLKNEGGESSAGILNDSLFSNTDDSFEELYGYYNLGCATELLEDKAEGVTIVKKKQLEPLPPVIKKKARCSQCNKRLNITNIYDCRCGQIFCSQHRYSEVHGCSYDYKTEGRKILEQQNPLVTAEKLNRI